MPCTETAWAYHIWKHISWFCCILQSKNTLYTTVMRVHILYEVNNYTCTYLSTWTLGLGPGESSCMAPFIIPSLHSWAACQVIRWWCPCMSTLFQLWSLAGCCLLHTCLHPATYAVHSDNDQCSIYCELHRPSSGALLRMPAGLEEHSHILPACAPGVGRPGESPYTKHGASWGHPLIE